MKKILASIAALAVASTMAVSAFAATTLAGVDEYVGDWSASCFVDAEGNVVNYIDNAYFADYLDTGCTVTITYDYKTLAGAYYEYYLFSVCDQSWAKLAATDASYVAGVPTEDEARVTKGGETKLYEGTSVPVYKYFTQSDGFTVFCQNDGAWTGDTFKFTLTADCLKYLAENPSTGDDGSEWGGIVFQTYGIDVKSITIDAVDDTIIDFATNANPNAGTDDPADDPADDDKTDDENKPTGASAGLALAAIALAGAAVVAAKKND